MKAQKTQQYVFKINSTMLAKNDWDLNLPIERARRVPGLIVSLADSQMLTWINELNGTENLDADAKVIRGQIKLLKKEPTCAENKRKIKNLYKSLYELQFKKDYVCVIMDKKSHYDRCNQGFKINGITYKRLLTTVNGVKTSTVVYTSERLEVELKKRIENGLNTSVELVPAKKSAYQALCASASVPVSWPKGVIVIHDCQTEFCAEMINIDDSDTSKEPIVTEPILQKVIQNCTDGCAMMLPSLSRRWNGELNGDYEHTVAGVNIRNSWTKGMAFTFDYIDWAEKHNTGYIVKDFWDQDRDIRDSELIITDNQLKLCKCYDSWEDYYNKCIENHYTMRVAKTAPHENDEVRQTNYQFLMVHHTSDSDINELISDTVNEIKDILSLDYRKTLVYMCGKGLDDRTVELADPVCRALMVDKNILSDPYLRNRIRRMIDKRIKDAKIGILEVFGNFQLISGDLTCLCESMFGLEIKGILKAGEIYSQHWRDRNVEQVVCYRAPMSNEHSVRNQNISYSEEAAYWFRYIDTCVVVSAWDTMQQALNGFDMDGDLLFTTNSPVLLRTHENLPALNCIQYNAEKKIVSEDYIIKSNEQGFGSHIGAITNRITQMTSLMANFSPDSEEYKILKYRTQCGQAQQQAEIDKAKGIVSNPMPKSWYVWSENKINDEDSDEVIAHKRLYQKLCAHKKPYFFQYNYDYLHAEYMKKKKMANENCNGLFHKTVDELLFQNNLTEEEANFISTYKNKSDLDFSPSTMNRICFFVEQAFEDDISLSGADFDYNIYKSGVQYSLQDYSAVKSLCQKYKYDSQGKIYADNAENKLNTEDELSEELNVDQLMLLLKQNINERVPNSVVQCEILLDLCYRDGFNKQIVWSICGDVIVETLLKKHDYAMKYPQKCKDGEFLCCGNVFSMKTFINRGDEDEEL